MRGSQRSVAERALSGVLRFIFRQIYHRFAWTYDSVALGVSLGRWYDWTYAVLPFVTGPRILEIGHGTGRLFSRLSRAHRLVVGLDGSRQMAALARNRIRVSNHAPPFVRGLAQYQPFNSGQFDCVVATFPTEFIFEPTTISEIHRVLEPGGRLLVLPVAWILGRTWMDRVAAWLFSVTRQVPPSPEQTIELRLLQPLRAAGFQADMQRLEVRASIVLLVLASKVSALPG